jgi:tRNA(Ile)-lysidine synthase
MIQTVADFFTRRSLPAVAGVVALSGGPDSVCLALILRALHRQEMFSRLVLAHLNHQLRGPESDADEAFVLALGQAWNLPCRTHRLDVQTVAKQNGANLEETSRRLRYDWLTQVARDEGALWVATGHSADDQAETVLHRLLRGSGLQGLSGMAARRPLAAAVDLVRPLLTVRRSAILAYLEEHGQTYRQDSSNQDPRFTRNRLRHDLFPVLVRDYNPGVVEVLCRLAEQACEVQAEMTRLAVQVLGEAELPRAGSMIVLGAGTLMKAVPHLRREAFRLVWQRENWPLGQMNFEAWDRLARLVDQKEAALDLPDGVRARRTGRVIRLERLT